jgi:hypothetical protein
MWYSGKSTASGSKEKMRPSRFMSLCKKGRTAHIASVGGTTPPLSGSNAVTVFDKK